MSPFFGQTHFLPASTYSLTPGNHQSDIHLDNFVISRTLYKQVHTLCNVLRLALFTQEEYLEIFPGCCGHKERVAFQFRIILHGIDAFIEPFTFSRISEFPVSGYYKYICSKCLCASLCVKKTYHFSGVNTFEWNFWVIWHLHVEG